MNNGIELAYRQSEADIRQRKPRMAICYDFDHTLSPDDMQAFHIIPSFGVNSQEFWAETNRMAQTNRMDSNLAWMYQMITYSREKNLPIHREYFRQIGAKVPLYKGVDTWFDRINTYAAQQGVELEHYIISSGLREIIEGSTIAPYFTRVYASSYLYDENDTAVWPAQAVNYTNKTQFLFRITKGYLEEYDDRVNKSIPDSQRYIPYSNIVYVGDSATDIPCMRLIKSLGGSSLGVYNPDSHNKRQMYQLYNDDRLSLFAPADYSEGSLLEQYAKKIVDDVAARERLDTERRILDRAAAIYRAAAEGQPLPDVTVDDPAPEELERIAAEIEALRGE